jgi:L-alanine-DL-glutamate epimerase-like enolase superfamily enzyme
VKITRARSFMLVVPVGREIADSMQSVAMLEIVGVIIDTDVNISGTGYTITVCHGGRVIRAVLDSMYCEHLVGKDPHNVREIWRELYFGVGHWIGRAGATTMAQAAIDIALWDVLAKDAELPLWQLLGGARSQEIPIYNTNAGWLNLSIEQLRAESLQLIEEGYTALKMKVGGPSVASDRARVAAIRKAVGDDILLMVDANQRWDAMQAAIAAQQLQEFQLGWLEEPMHPDDIPAHATLRQRTSLPIALGEHVYSTLAFRDFIASAAVDVIQVDVCRVGGITPWLEVAALANVNGLRVCPHAGDLMQVHQHLVKVIPNSWFLEVIPLWQVGPFQQQVRLQAGKCLTPFEPGASTDITQAAFDRFAVH